MRIGEHLEIYDFEYIMDRALSHAPSDVDTREGSIIYDALAPACMELAEAYMLLRNQVFASFVTTAFDEYLDLHVSHQGLSRYEATRAIKLGYFEGTDGHPMVIPRGARFSTIGTQNLVTYIVVGAEPDPGFFRLECEEEGTLGNLFSGALLPITHINDLGRAELSTLLVPGQDREKDDDLRQRFFYAVTEKAFGGNVIQYRQEILDIQGMGGVQIYPTWDGGGTVKAVIIDASFNLVSQSFIEMVQELLDPRQEGNGLGLAPIGHRVTVTTPTPRYISVTVKVDFDTGYGLTQLDMAIEDAVDDYFLVQRRRWDHRDSLNKHHLTLFRSQIMASILQIEGVANVSEILLDGIANDVPLIQASGLQELPFVKDVMIYEN